MQLSQWIRIARWLLLAMTIAFAFWRFSEPTADPDLWGHVLYGQRTVAMMEVEHEEPFSWTAEGHRWINHEQIAEIVMGLVHGAAGSAGLFWLMLTISSAAFLGAIYFGQSKLRWSVIAWVVGLLMCREVAIGFAMRPQLFSAVFFVVFLAMTRSLMRGSVWPVFTLPILLCVWINTHGAALLALIILLICIGSSALAPVVSRWSPAPLKPYLQFDLLCGKKWCCLLLATVLSWLAVGITPYGFDLLVWLIESVRYVRPEITEWNPTALSLEHILFFVSFPLFALLACINRNSKQAWEIGLITVLFIAAFRHERHIALYSLAYIIIVPAYIEQFLQRTAFQDWAIKQIEINRLKLMMLSSIFLLSTIYFVAQGLSQQSESRFRMQVPMYEYPVSAMQFINEHDLSGNLIVNFNWAQMAIWELPNCRVSFDGRLDTSYPRELIEAHWDLFYHGTTQTVAFEFGEAELVLIPPSIALNDQLKQDANWRVIYKDPLATLYLNEDRIVDWTKATIYGGLGAVSGSEHFPDTKAQLARP